MQLRMSLQCMVVYVIDHCLWRMRLHADYIPPVGQIEIIFGTPEIFSGTVPVYYEPARLISLFDDLIGIAGARTQAK